MSNFLELSAPPESPERLLKRSDLVFRLENLAADWVTSLFPGAAQPKLLLFGSSLLGVLTPDSDIDTVLVFGPKISREMVFSGFVKKLQSECDFLSAIPDAHVPVIKLSIEGFSVDILTAHVPADFLKQIHSDKGSILYPLPVQEIDNPSLLSLNGVRVGQIILRILRGSEDGGFDLGIEADRRVALYQNCLRLIKYWARKRGIYSNAMGFFGGITWAILLARNFQIDNTLSDEASVLIFFFRVWSTWQWGGSSPVSLKTLPTSLSANKTRNGLIAQYSADSMSEPIGTSEEQGAMWDPSASEIDRKAFMPILTPAAPFMNSTFNTLLTNYRILKDEFRRGFDTLKDNNFHDDILNILCEDAQAVCGEHVLQLKIQIKVWGIERERRIFNWQGIVESKLRVLMLHLEKIPNLICRPFPDPPIIDETDCLVTTFRIILKLEDSNRINLNSAVDNFRTAICLAIDARSDASELVKNSKVSIFV